MYMVALLPNQLSVNSAHNLSFICSSSFKMKKKIVNENVASRLSFMLIRYDTKQSKHCIVISFKYRFCVLLCKFVRFCKHIQLVSFFNPVIC